MLNSDQISHASDVWTQSLDAVAIVRSILATAPGSAEESAGLAALASMLKSAQRVPQLDDDGAAVVDAEGNVVMVDVVIPRAGHIVSDEDAPAVAAAAVAHAATFARITGACAVHASRV